MTNQRPFALILLVVCLVGLGALLFAYVQRLSADIGPEPASQAAAGSIHAAAESGNVSAIQAAIRAGAPVDQPAESDDTTRRGLTPLSFAIMADKPEAVQALLAAGAKVE